jgi:hypothetical protein
MNITVNEELLEKVKRYAEKRQTSLSQLIEQYFRTLVSQTRKKNILEFMEDLPAAKVVEPGDERKKYYDREKVKYGFPDIS